MDIRIVVTAACVLLAGLGVPLILRRVPPNPLYGLRTRRSLSHPSIWYPANAWSGRALLIAAAATTAATWLVPDTWPEWVPVACLVLAMVVVLVASLIHLRRYPVD
ncbi:SdpI family protein [Luteimonas saliphila]|uniref:SdpI family protein n=1 Tax=Luteimonas saliphila TaxID=2804919 RepID=UPI00192E27F9|nr:SdpI family protein [Luteimonas saliphila]